MKINSIYIAGFGKLSDYKMDFGDGLTVVIGDNEFGKSTILAFVRAMFYGFPARSSARILDFDRKKYKPWHGDLFGGSMEFTDKGQRYLLEKVFGRRRADDRTVLSVLPVGHKLQTDQREIGEILFDLREAEFVNTVFVGQLASSFENTDRDASTLAARLSADGDPGNLANDFDVIRGRLKNAMSLLDQTRGQGGLLFRLGNEREALLARQTAWSQRCVQAEEWQVRILEASALQTSLADKILEAERFVSEKEAEIASFQLRIREAEMSLDRKKQETNYLRDMEEHSKALTREKEAAFAMQKEALAFQQQVVRREKELLDERQFAVSQQEAYLEQAGNPLPADRLLGTKSLGWTLGLSFCIGLLVFIASQNILSGLAAMLVSSVCILLGIFLYKRNKRELYSDDPDANVRKKELEKLVTDAKVQERIYNEARAVLAKREKDSAEAQKMLSHTRMDTPAQDPVSEADIRKALDILLQKQTIAQGRLAEARSYIKEEKSKRENLLVEIARMETTRESLLSACAVEGNLKEQMQEIDERIMRANEYSQDLQVAMLAMEEAAGRMERDYVPRVNARAGIYLSALTDGKYTTVQTDRTFHVSIATDGEYSYQDAGYFSGGTMDQIFLAIRLAISDILAKSDDAMTILLDDSLVQYDDRRAKAAIRMLNEMSARRQIILFSCQTRMTEIYKQVREEGKKA